MALTKFVVRVLTAEDQLLAWAEVVAEPEPQDRSLSASCPFWPTPRRTEFIADTAGTAAKLSVHWCDLDIARVAHVFEGGGVELQVGNRFVFHWFEPVWLVAGQHKVPLPTVTVNKHVILSPPSASFGLHSTP